VLLNVVVLDSVVPLSVVVDDSVGVVIDKVDDWELEETLVELVNDDDDAVVPEAVLVEVLLIVVVRTPMQMYCMPFEG
jgi:hypothetical protein